MILDMKYVISCSKWHSIIQGLLWKISHTNAKLIASTWDDHNFLIQTPIHAFLDSMERYLSLESNHIIVNGI